MDIINFDGIAETIHTMKLGNKLPVYVVTKPGFNKSYAFFATDYGGADRRFSLDGTEYDTPAGVAHFLEHKMFDEPEGGNALAALSANGASPNAFTSSDMTAYYFESTEAFNENLEKLLSFVSIPYFTPESVQKEQGIIGQEIRMIEDSPEYVVYYSLLKSLFSHHPIRDSVAGTIESISEITDETLYACHKAFYNTANMALVVVGDIIPEEVVKIAEKILPDEGGEKPLHNYGEPDTAPPSSPFTESKMEVSQPLFIIGSKAGAAPLKGKERLRYTLVSEIALNCVMGHSSPLYSRLYADGLLNEKFGAELDYSAGTCVFLASGESREPTRVLDEINAEVARIASAGVDSGLFERQKKAVYGEKLRGLDYFSRLSREIVAGEFAGYRYLDAFEIISSINRQEIDSFISSTLAPERLALSVVSPLR